MPQSARPRPLEKEDEQWVIWNGSMGIVTMGTLGKVEITDNGRLAWLDIPFDVVGPFNLNELETSGCISFAACIVMSRQRWKKDQVELRRAAFEQRQKMYERLNQEYGYFGGDAQQRHNRNQGNEQLHRKVLKLPIEGKITVKQIKDAFRRLAQKAHPDTGGSHEEFVRLSEARSVLIERVASN